MSVNIEEKDDEELRNDNLLDWRRVKNSRCVVDSQNINPVNGNYFWKDKEYKHSNVSNISEVNISQVSHSNLLGDLIRYIFGISFLEVCIIDRNFRFLLFLLYFMLPKLSNYEENQGEKDRNDNDHNQNVVNNRNSLSICCKKLESVDH